MSDELDATQEQDGPDELTLLKERATTIGIKYHPSIGVVSLKEKIESKLNGPKEEVPEPKVTKQKTVAKETKAMRHSRLRKEANKLVRVRLNCMNPAKRNWKGEIISVSNSVIGTIKKYIPFSAEGGYHIQAALLEQLKERRCQIFNEIVVNGRKMKKGKLIREFSIEILPPLTNKELSELAQRQALNHSIDQEV